MNAARVRADDAYHVAIVYLLEEPDAAMVRELRAIAADENTAPDHPHLTLLYLGRMPGATISDVTAFLEPLAWPSLEGRVSGVGAFTAPGRVVVHLEVERAAELVAAHERAYATCASQPWFAPGPWAGEGWRPHVTLAERRTTFDVSDARLQRAVGRIMPLRRAAIAAQNLHPIIVTELTAGPE